MNVFRLEADSLLDTDIPKPSGGADYFTNSVLLYNVRWFTRIRWSVVAILALFGLAGLFGNAEWLRHFNITGAWPLVLAAVLALLNLVSMAWSRLLASRKTGLLTNVSLNIWFQIITDLAVLSVMVCRIGPTTTVIAFAYLFHITLACIFFGRRDSFLITLLSISLFLTTVVLTVFRSFVASACGGSCQIVTLSVSDAAAFAVPAIAVWLIVWYLVSSLSDAVRQRDRDLEAANQRLRRVDEAINQQMLRVTHDLKAPFAGIESNIQILKTIHWDETPESVRRIIDKIDARSAALRSRIGDILMLGSLRSAPPAAPESTVFSLRTLLDSVRQDVAGLAAERRVSIAVEPGNVQVFSNPHQLKILFMNLVANAVTYSREGDPVEVGMKEEAGTVLVRITDHGIGISEKALPHIFEDFYRTPEAVSFNSNSTGLGLAIVRQIALNLKLAICVQSDSGKGTVFEVSVPAAC